MTAFAFLLTGLALGLSGCRKAIEDYLKYYPTAEYGFCQLRQINIQYPAAANAGTLPVSYDTMAFTYNAHGDPVSGIRPVPRTGAPNFFFRYDHLGRLTDAFGSYGTDPHPTGYCEVWHRYKYDNWGHANFDSMYIFPLVVDDHPTLSEYSSLNLNAYEYDSKGRISKFTYHTNYFPFVTNFSYDADGNLTGTPHDNEINLHRTSKVWMFLDRDYSVNNPLTAAYTYNDRGLPISIVAPTGTKMHFSSLDFDGLEYGEAHVIYSCK